MTPSEASRELARVTAIVRATGRRNALWSAVVPLSLLPVLVVVAAWLPAAWLSRPGAALPLLLGVAGLVIVGVGGLAVGLSLRAYRLRQRAAEIEAARGLARGDLLGAIELAGPAGHDDPAGLIGLHRARVASFLRGGAVGELLPSSSRRLRRLQMAALPVLVAVGAASSVGFAANPAATRGAVATLARPWRVTFPPPPPPMRLTPPGGEVLRGGAFEVAVLAEGRSRVTLAHSRVGIPVQRDTLVVLDGVAVASLDPVDEGIRVWAEDEWGGVTDTFDVVPVDPLTITELRIEVEYPRYLARADESLSGLASGLQVPEGSRLHFRARVNHPVDRVGLVGARKAGIDTVWMDLAGEVASGIVTALDSTLMSWWLVPSARVPGVRTPPPFALTVVADSPPTVRIPHPGQDLALGLDRSLRLVVEASDDHGVGEVGLTWWRVAAGGLRDAPMYERLADGGGGRRLVLRPILDLEAIGVLPGDEIVYFASASDMRPGAPPSVSDTFRARLSGLDEVREEVARQAARLAEETRSLREQASSLSEEARDAERRGASYDPVAAEVEADAGQSDFGATEEARDAHARALELEAELARVQQDLSEARKGLASSSLSDPELDRRLGEMEKLFQEMLETGLRDKIEALEEALRGLDRDGLRSALAELSREGSALEDRLDRMMGLMERVALEQTLETVRQKAEDLAQAERVESAGGTLDEGWRERQERMAERADALADQLEEVSDRLAGHDVPDVSALGREAGAEARAAASDMRSAASREEEREGAQSPRQEARAAADHMTRAEETLEAAAQSLTADWRADAMETLGRAASDALELAREQDEVVESLRSGKRTEHLAGRQSALREGLDNLSQSLAEAGRKTALMDRRAGPAAAEAGNQMDAMENSLSGGESRRGEAVRQGQAAMEALADLAGALMSSRRAMAEASSATGMEEALEKLAGAGRRQEGVNGTSGELLLFMQGGESIEDRLGSLAARQEAVARELRDLADDPAARALGARPGELAAEAEEIARSLSVGQLDRSTLARQQQLFRRLLDAGRSLEKDDEDPNRREAASARPRVTLAPATDAGAASGPRYPYPDVGSMEGLTPAQRRLVYEYFDRLNRGAVGGVP